MLESDRIKFDEFIKRLSCLNTVHDEKALAGPGEIPGKSKNLYLDDISTIMLMQFY